MIEQQKSKQEKMIENTEEPKAAQEKALIKEKQWKLSRQVRRPFHFLIPLPRTTHKRTTNLNAVSTHWIAGLRGHG